MKHPLLFTLALLPLAASGAETLYVQSTKAKLMAEPSFASASIKEIEKGEKVSVEQKNERWVRVKHEGSVGWVSALLLSTQKPVNKITVLDEAGAGAGVSENARRRASAVITAGATRGLTADDRRRAGDEVSTNYAALRWVENITISEAQTARFEAEDAQ